MFLFSLKLSHCRKVRTIKQLLLCKNCYTFHFSCVGVRGQMTGTEVWDGESSSQDLQTVALLKACAQNKDLRKGIRMHADILNRGLLETNYYVANTLVSMYAKCGALVNAHNLIEGLLIRNVVSWNALIAGYVQQGKEKEALNCFDEMQSEGIYPNTVTYISILKACGNIQAIELGQQIHEEIIKQNLLGKDVLLGTALVDMYAKCGVLETAQQLLDELPVRDVISWSALIAGYAQQGQLEEALTFYDYLQREGFCPNAVTFISILKACGSIGAIDKGKQFHDEILSQGLLGESILLGTALMDMYIKCGALLTAWQVLEKLPVEDIVCWNTLMAGYAQHGQGVEALKCYDRMHKEGLSPNVVTYICALKACGSIGAVDKGKQIHDGMVSYGLVDNDIVLGTALVDMYAKCGALSKAQEVCDRLPFCSLLCWIALISGYVLQEQGEEALGCYEQMQHKNFSPNRDIFSFVLKACGSIAAAGKGKQTHHEIVCLGFVDKEDILLDTILVDMYAKCGALAEAQLVLDELHVRDVVSWSALISGYAQQGQMKEALGCLEQMQNEGLSPNAVTLTCVLCACSRTGMVDEGQTYVACMSERYAITPDLGHQTCLMDLFARAGDFEKAQVVLEKISLFNDSSVLSALLGSCLQWGNLKLGIQIFEHAEIVNC